MFEPPVLGFIGIAATVACLCGVAAGAWRSQPAGDSLLRGLEAAVLSACGALLARGFLPLVLHLLGDSPGGRLFVAWCFMPLLAVVETVAWLADSSLVTATFMLWVATVGGAFIGLMDGAFRIHDWRGPAWIWCPLDVTWGLARPLHGCLCHAVNFGLRVPHAFGTNEERHGAHRHLGGFAFRREFAVTQGAVMSNMLIRFTSGAVTDFHPWTPLFAHENTHVLQNRLFGPLFTLTYLGWMGVWLSPALLIGTFGSHTLSDAVMWLAYYNNPWEVWAYKIGGHRDEAHALCWPDAAVVTSVLVLMLVAGVGMWLIFPSSGSS